MFIIILTHEDWSKFMGDGTTWGRKAVGPFSDEDACKAHLKEQGYVNGCAGWGGWVKNIDERNHVGDFAVFCELTTPA